MIRLPIIHPESSYATAVTLSRNKLVLEPIRIFNGQWCVRRGGQPVPASADEIDAFILPDHTVTDGVGEWARLSKFLADRGLVVPGDRDTIGDALRAAHWRRIALPVERYRGRGSDAGVKAAVARGSADQRRAA